MHDGEAFHASTADALDTLGEGDVPDSLDLVIEQRITDGGSVVSTHHVRLRAGTATTAVGPADDADLVITQDIETARALQAGDTHAQTAFLTGRLTVDGDINVLLDAGPDLAAVLAALSPEPPDA